MLWKEGRSFEVAIYLSYVAQKVSYTVVVIGKVVHSYITLPAMDGKMFANC